MKTSMNQLLTWLKEFQTNWLTENIPNNNIVESIKTKLQEFEKLIIGKRKTLFFY